MNEIITDRLIEYDLKTALDEQNAIKEITQEVILYALSKTKFFEEAYFCGGTALRIVHGLNRFSEDLDFSTRNVATDFQFDDYLPDVLSTLKDYGLDMVIKKSKDDGFIKAREFKEDSQKWKLSFPSNQRLKKIIIKLEIDSNPPSGAIQTPANLDFPILHQVRVGSLETLFAGKIHALLCRSHVKGRDWYDLLWYLKKRVSLNYPFLQNSLFQMGPFQGQSLGKLNRDFIINALVQKIESLDWKSVTGDVERFLKQEELSSLKLWGKELFSEKVRSLKE
ncbi:MAG: nucleotidyl transferase AbiEii/AbiGii toxin family protein [Bacteriovoracaceae bacterium]